MMIWNLFNKVGHSLNYGFCMSWPPSLIGLILHQLKDKENKTKKIKEKVEKET